MSQPQGVPWLRIFLWSVLATVPVLGLAAVCDYLLRQRGAPDSHALPRDVFLAKYEQIGPGTSEDEAIRLFGAPTDSFYPGGALGDSIQTWSDGRGRHVVVTWDLTGQFVEKKFYDVAAP